MNQIDLKDRLAVVTGGAQGLGLAIARRFVESGARVVIWDRDGDAAERDRELSETVGRQFLAAEWHIGRGEIDARSLEPHHAGLRADRLVVEGRRDGLELGIALRPLIGA